MLRDPAKLAFFITAFFIYFPSNVKRSGEASLFLFPGSLNTRMLRDPAKLAVRQAKQSLPDGGKEKASTSKAWRHKTSGRHVLKKASFAGSLNIRVLRDPGK
jgi:hypothetical protein